MKPLNKLHWKAIGVGVLWVLGGLAAGLGIVLAIVALVAWSLMSSSAHHESGDKYSAIAAASSRL